MNNTFFYDAQIRRFLIQFIRIMSNFQVEFGTGAYQQVPVFYGDSSRQVAQILRGNSENSMPSVPAMACYISAFDYDRARVQEPYHVSKLQIRERSYDHATDTWGHDQGDAFSIERLMPVPYKLTLKVDIWTSNTNQKLQLLEQMLPLFNPALEIQSTDNYVDWTSLSAIYLESTNWTTRQIPVGANEDIDVSTLTFTLPIWLSLPAKVKKMGVIEKIIASIYDAHGNLTEDILAYPAADLLAQRVITPMNYGVIYYSNMLQLYREDDLVIDTIDGTAAQVKDVYSWKTLVDLYGSYLKPGISEVRLEQPNGTTVVGTVAYHPSDATLLLFTPYTDTIPANTLLAVNAIIDPFTMPIASYLTAVAGTRYLILNDIGSPGNDPGNEPIAWPNSTTTGLEAKANDIIEFDGTNWFVSFNAAAETTVKYCTNIKSGLQFKWLPETQEWNKSIEGKYSNGDWTIILSAP